MRENRAMHEPLLNYPQMANELGVPVRTLRSLVYRGVVPHVRLGHRLVFFQASKVAKAIAKREVKEV